MNQILESFQLQFQALVGASPQILGALAAFVLFVVLGKLVSKGIGRLLGEQRSNIKQMRLVKVLSQWVFNLLGLVVALNVLGLSEIAVSFLAAGGLVAVVFGFAFKEIGENLLAGLFLSFSRSFDVGDLIESNGMRGIVKRIEVRAVHIRTADGCDIFIPSAMIYKNPLHNFTRDGLRQGAFKLGIDYGDNPGEAQSLIFSTISESGLVLEEPAPQVQLAAFAPGYVELSAFFWINTFASEEGLESVRTVLMKRCHQVLTEHGFTFSANVTTSVDMNPLTVKLNQ